MSSLSSHALTNSSPSLAVLIATFNGSKHVSDQLLSIVNQLDSDDIILIRDDCSSDDTVDVCRKLLLTSRVRFEIFSNAVNIGPNKTFQKLLSSVPDDVKYVAISDQDDFWLPNKRQLIFQNLASHKYYFGNSFFFVEGSSNSMPSGEECLSLPSTFDIYPPSKNLFVNLVRPTPIGCHLAFQADQLGLFRSFPRSVYMYDMYIGIHACLSFSFSIDPRPSMVWRRHRQCVTPVATTLIFKIKIRALYLICILRAMIDIVARRVFGE